MDEIAVKALASAVKSPDVLKFDSEHQVVVAPHGWSVHDISKFLPPPDRIKQRVELLTLASFVDYVTEFKGVDTVIFANENDGTYDAVMDYHGTKRGTVEHVGRYACPTSDQWKLWSKHDETRFTQADFGRFIEDNLIDIVSPVSAEMLEIVLSLQIHKSAAFKSDVRLDNGGTSLAYEETTKSSTKTGNVTIPDTFQIGIPVFIDGHGYAINARLRYELGDGKLEMWYELVRPLDVFRKAVKEVSDSIRAKLTDVSFWIGRRA